jgi:molybdopterin-dependent oxidoreductase alpha subunit
MAKPKRKAGGGLPAILYVFRKAREAGGFFRFYKRMRSRNVCKTCALGMGGQRGGMVNEAGHFPEVCKKSVQAQAGDMARAIDESFFARTPIAALERLTSREMEALGRLAFPIRADEGDTHFRRVSWDEALDRCAVALRESPPPETFFYGSGRSSNEGAFLMQLVARAYGTPNIHNCSFYCHAASGVALSKVYGSGTASVVLDDLRHADLAIVAGANPASNHPRLITQLVQLRRRGGHVIVVNPLREVGLERFRIPSDWRSLLFGSRVSDVYIMPHVGGDVALFKALLKALIERGAIDEPFISEHTSGFDAVRAELEAASFEELVQASGVDRAAIDACAEILARAKRGICLWAMGLTHHQHGVDNIFALTNLALARGWLGRPGTGLLPIRGHSNVQGVGSMGVSPVVKEAFAARLEQVYGIRVPREPGQDTYASMIAADKGRVRVAVLVGGNLFSSNPDRAWTTRALRKIPFSFSLTTKLNPGHVHGRGRTSIVVPVLARDEEHEPTTQESMFNFVRLSEGGTPNIDGELRSEVEVLCALAERILPAGRFDWSALRSHRSLREGIAATVPGHALLARIDETKVEFQIDGRTFHEPRFATADGRACFVVTPLPSFAPREGELRLMTIRSEGQFNSVVYEEEDAYRGNDRRDVVMMNAHDARGLGLAEGQRVRVETEVGAMEVHVAVVDIRAGNIAMYYPEANAIVPRKLDARSKTPAFKSVAARIRALGDPLRLAPPEKGNRDP